MLKVFMFITYRHTHTHFHTLHALTHTLLGLTHTDEQKNTISMYPSTKTWSVHQNGCRDLSRLQRYCQRFPQYLMMV